MLGNIGFFFSRGEGSGKVLIDYDLSEFADVEHLQRCGKHSMHKIIMTQG